MRADPDISSTVPPNGSSIRPLVPAGPIELRRAVCAALLRAGRPLTLNEIVYALWSEERVDVARLESSRRSARQVIADLLRAQVEAGRVERVRPATYAIVADAMSPSTRWRSLHWREIQASEVQGR